LLKYKYKNIKKHTKVHIKSYTNETVNGCPNRDSNRQNSVGVPSKSIARYPGN